MPGRLLQERSMNNATAIDEHHDGVHRAAHGPSPTVNGIHPHTASAEFVGGTSTGQQQPQLNGVRQEHRDVKDALARTMDQLPPEIQHITENFMALSTLFERVSQQCFNELDNLVSNVQDSSSNKPATNDERMKKGDLAFNVLEQEDAKISNDDRKKLNWLRFAQIHRDRFIKLLVLLQWSPQVDGVSKLIDLYAWSHQQEGMFTDSVIKLSELTMALKPIKIPSPDIDTALEVLSTGRSSRKAPIGYIPDKTLDPSKILQTLKDINISLHIRLNLHETLPKHFKDFSISDGRATFQVPSEFEVDLSIADEDPSSQFYFIDIRLLFKPALEIPASQIKDQLEVRVNEVLGADGLAGCYDFLHDFVLTHKITILRKQALEMNRTNWAGSIRTEMAHRSLVVQYWLNRPGPKSWFEVGVSSGKPKDQDLLQRPDMPSHLAVRWIREGKEVKDDQIPINTRDLSLEQILRSILAKHMTHILESTHHLFTSRNAPSVEPILFRSETSPIDCKLLLALKTYRQRCVSIETTTGDFVLQPTTRQSQRCEEILKQMTKPAEELFPRLHYRHACEIQTQVEHDATRFGWNVDKYQKFDINVIRRVFGPQTLLCSIFRKPAWIDGWALVATIGSNHETWWVAKLGVTEQDPQISMAESLHWKERTTTPEIFYTKLERLAVAKISIAAISHQLKAASVRYSEGTIAEDGLSHIHPLEIDISQLLARASASSPVTRGDVKLWSSDVVSLVHRGFNTDKWNPRKSTDQMTVINVIRGKLSGSDAILKAFANTSGPDVQFDDVGHFWITFRSPLGYTRTVSELAERLQSIACLKRIAEALTQVHIPIEDLNSDMISFMYATSSSVVENLPDTRLVAELKFRKGKIDLSFAPSGKNPHTRIVGYLARYINQSDTNAISFKKFIDTLRSTLPLLRALDTILPRYSNNSSKTNTAKFEATAGSDPTLVIRGLDTYRITYPRARLSLNIHLNTKGDDGYWQITHQTEGSAKPYDYNTKLVEALSKTFADTAGGEGWYGMRSSVVTSITAVEVVLNRVDQAVKELEKDMPKLGKGERPARYLEKQNNKAQGNDTEATGTSGKALSAAQSQTEKQPSQGSQQAQSTTTQVPSTQHASTNQVPPTKTSNNGQQQQQGQPHQPHQGQPDTQAVNQRPEQAPQGQAHGQRSQQANGVSQKQQQQKNTINPNGNNPKKPDVIELD